VAGAGGGGGGELVKKYLNLEMRLGRPEALCRCAREVSGGTREKADRARFPPASLPRGGARTPGQTAISGDNQHPRF
jgi:hypothetical protein